MPRHGKNRVGVIIYAFIDKYLSLIYNIDVSSSHNFTQRYDMKYTKLIALILCGVMCLSACSSDGSPDTEQPQRTEQADPDKPNTDMIDTDDVTDSVTDAVTEDTTQVITEPVTENRFEGKVLAFYVMQDENEGIYSDMSFDISDSEITYDVPYLYNMDMLKACKPKVLCSDGVNARFSSECMNGDGTVDLIKGAQLVCTDANGAVKLYSVQAKRKYLSLPVISITVGTDIADIKRDEYTQGTFSMTNSEFDDISNAEISIRGRGHSTWQWEKKPYKIKFSSATSLFDLEAKRDWVLLANYSDKSLIRNTLAHKLSEKLDGIEFKLHQYPVDVFINGSYIGVYTLGEHLEVNRGRVDIGEDYTDVDTGYLLECGGVDNEVDVKGIDFFHTETVKFLRIKSPDTRVMSKEHFTFISDYVNAADTAIRTLDGYEEYIDVDSFIDWFILHELSYNLDSCFRRSCYMYKEKGGKLKMSPAWDFDLAFGNFSSDNKYYNDFASEGKDGEKEYIKVTWYNYLLKDEAFRKKLRARWDAVGNELYSYAVEYIDEYYAKVKPSAELNFKVWDILDKKAGYQPSFMKKHNTYEKQISYLKNFLKSRFNYLDDNI